MKLVIAEKPSVGRTLAVVLGASKKQDGYLEGNGWLVSWCVGHLAELASAEPSGAGRTCRFSRRIGSTPSARTSGTGSILYGSFCSGTMFPKL